MKEKDSAQERLIIAAKAAYILIREQIERMDDEDAEDIMNELRAAINAARGR